MNVRIAECRMRCSVEAGNSHVRDSPPLASARPTQYCTVSACLSERLVRVFNSTLCLCK